MLTTDIKYLEIGLFNVLQSLLFNASQSTGKKQAEFIDHFKWLWTHHCDKVFGRSEAQKYLLGQAISKETDDVLHTYMAIELCKRLSIWDTSIDEREIFDALME